MSPTTSVLFGLMALVSQAFSASIPVKAAVSLAESSKPLSSNPPGFYDIPGTQLSISIVPSSHPGPALPSLNSALACITAAKAPLAAKGSDAHLPQTPSWEFTSAGVHLSANAILSQLGTYGQLASAMTGLEIMLRAKGGPGARELNWFLTDQGKGNIINGTITQDGSSPPRRILGLATPTANATPSASASRTATSSSAKSTFTITSIRLYKGEVDRGGD